MSDPIQEGKPLIKLARPFFYTFFLLMLKLMLFRVFLFDDAGWSRLPADGLALLAILCLVELVTPAAWKRICFFIVNLIFSLILFASTVYYSYYGSVPTYTALLALKQVMQIRASVESTVEPLYFLFFADLIVLFAVWMIYRKKTAPAASFKSSLAWKTGVVVVALVCLFVSGRYIQSGGSIANENAELESLGFLDYQVSAAIKLKRDDEAAKGSSLKDLAAELDKLHAAYPLQTRAKKLDKPAYFGAAKGKNLIIVQLEAFQNFPIHLSLGGQELTPVLSRMADEGLYFPHVFQQIGQGNTADAEFMSNTSIYPTGKIAMSMGYGDRALPSLPRLLQKYGYEASTFHVNDVKFWDRNKLYPALNFDRYYDKPFYNNDHFNDFGPSDEELYKLGMEKILARAKQNKPFYAQFVTASSHHPFKIPDDRKRISIPESMQGTQLGDYLTAVNYTDYALGTFIDRLKQEGLWDNTVLVVYGDHFGLQPQDNDPAFIKSQLGITYDPHVSRFNIPLIIHVPGHDKGQLIEQAGGQLDILPTVANLLGVNLKSEHFTAFGHDLLNIERNTFGMRYYLPTGSFINNDILFVPGKGFDDGTAVSIKSLEPVKDISPYRQDYEYTLKLMQLSDEYVRLLPKRAP